ncbi:MAG: Eco57I restriction-modification methylase domain-containing protein, partial [Thermoguttaceae bacterium]|nr:Eco57I restriction-modification methylase domain-containing protein [Thermoguttaceae bacterium]
MSQPFFPGSSVNPDNFLNSVYKPDVLQCLANLSSDEVFTPPDIVNQMLDLMPKSLWSNPEARFLDPVSKSGVFLREIAKRLIAGLELEIPDLQTRLDHIFHNQLFGIAITELTSLVSRRTLYCSKDAHSKYSVSRFDSKSGNIFYSKRTKHKWENGKCIYCGASQTEYEREDALESYAYQFIHPGKVFDDMKFDVIVGNPPYQLSDGGAGASAKPIYNLFVEAAKKLNPRYVTMIIPSRWFSGGKGLDSFRDSMLNDRRIRVLSDFFDATECFPGIDLSGGVCFFLWDRDHEGQCKVVSSHTGKTNTLTRELLEPGADVFVRFNEAVSILRKVRSFNEDSFDSIVSESKPFGLRTFVRPDKSKTAKSLKYYAYPNDGFISEDKITVGKHRIKGWKVYIASAYGERGSLPYLVLGKPFLGEPNSCCSETYLVITERNYERTNERT